jgi:hypothetical protein
MDQKICVSRRDNGDMGLSRPGGERTASTFADPLTTRPDTGTGGRAKTGYRDYVHMSAALLLR